jgi:hypothetical protein
MPAPNDMQKSPITVTKGGAPATGWTATTDDPAILQIQSLGPDTFGVGISAGSGAVTITRGTQTALLPYTVTEAPLVPAWGEPVPKE